MQTAFPVVPGKAVNHLFGQMQSLHGIAEAGLHGFGRVLANRTQDPFAAILAVGDFMICAGETGPWTEPMLRYALLSEPREWLIHCPDAWYEDLQQAGQVDEIERWAFSEDRQPEDHCLQAMLSERPEVVFQPIVGEWIGWCRERSWARDFVDCFADDHAFETQGLGVVAMVNGEAVSGASSYVAYPGGIEIQVQTHDGDEGHGYARLAAAKLILMAHERGLKATWDAANPTSAHIAARLGYGEPMPYRMYQLHQ